MLLINHLHLNNQYNTTNSNTLANDLTKPKINSNHRLLTLDIEDLYVNIPIDEAINTTKTQLAKNKDSRTTNQITSLLEVILKQNYLSFKPKSTKQIKV